MLQEDQQSVQRRTVKIVLSMRIKNRIILPCRTDRRGVHLYDRSCLSDTLVTVTLWSLGGGLLTGAISGAIIGHRKIVDLTDFTRPAYRRALRGALIGIIFGAYLAPKLTLITYIIIGIIARSAS